MSPSRTGCDGLRLHRGPGRYGVGELDASGRPQASRRNPRIPKSPYAVTGLTLFDNPVVEIAERACLRRGELGSRREPCYLRQGTLCASVAELGFAWLDRDLRRCCRQQFRAEHRERGADDLVPRGDRVASRLDSDCRRRAARTPHAKQSVWPVPAAHRRRAFAGRANVSASY